MANYAIDSKLLKPYLPHKTELDLWNGNCYVSLVGFKFVNTKVLGLPIPFHRNFEEINLRFYVRYKQGNEWKRGVTFIKEIVPKHAITFVANSLYAEKYQTMPTTHKYSVADKMINAEYAWKYKGNWHCLSIACSGDAAPITPGSEEEFITEHYWGYTKVKHDRTAEYGVEHPKWNVYNADSYEVKVDAAAIYGQEFAGLNTAKPNSVFMAEGSEIIVRKGIRI